MSTASERFFVKLCEDPQYIWGGCTEPLRLDSFLAVFSSNRGPGLAPSATVPRIRPG
jgi:hypothetical protein